MESKTNSESEVTIPVYVGTMGWGYEDWAGPFYPAETTPREGIALYARAFDAVEIDSTFYGTPRETVVRHWRAATPDHFVFCPKVPRLITHDQGLIDVAAPLRRFVEVMSLLGPKRGPMLLQMPPSFTRAELPALTAFLPLLREFNDPGVRFAIEFRHRSLIGPDVSALLLEHNVALVSADYVGMPRQFTATADIAYLRLIGKHGAFDKHDKPYADRSEDVDRWAQVLRTNQSLFRAAYVFCNNDFEGYSPSTANKFKARLGQKTTDRPPKTQGSLF